MRACDDRELPALSVGADDDSETPACNAAVR
jgi:hypothetical protein